MAKNVTLHRTDDQLEAFAFLASFAFFVITHLRSPISLVTIALLGFNVFSLQDYVRSDKAKIEIAQPLSENTSFSLMPEAIAQIKNEIKIDGKLFGYFDPDVIAWKLVDKPVLLVHQKSSGAIFTVRVDALKSEQMKQYKQ